MLNKLNSAVPLEQCDCSRACAKGAKLHLAACKTRRSHLVPVDVIKAIEQHLHDLLDFCQGELYIGVAQQPGQVMLTEVKHQVDAAFVSVELSGWQREGERTVKYQDNKIM